MKRFLAALGLACCTGCLYGPWDRFSCHTNDDCSAVLGYTCDRDKGECVRGPAPSDGGTPPVCPAADGGGGGVATEATPCPAANARACAGTAGARSLVCSPSSCTWVGVECGEDQRCDSTTGTCRDVLPECANRQPGEAFCTGSTRQVCGPDLVSLASSRECPDVTHCQQGAGGECATCLAGEYHCDPSSTTLKTCAESHLEFVAVSTCATPELCDARAGKCQSPVCAPQDRRCQGNELQQCNAGRTGFELQQTCAEGLCDGVLLQCNDCQPNTSTCTDSVTSVTCSNTGHRLPEVACTGDTPSCGEGGRCVACVADAQCPDLDTNPCIVPACVHGACSIQFVERLTLLPETAQVAHDCQQRVCDGQGQTIPVADSLDLPEPDSTVCTTEVCMGTGIPVPTHQPVEAGIPCEGGGVCNGHGACGECVPDARDCQGNQPRQCDASGHWQLLLACSAAEPVCSHGACVHPVSLAAGDMHTCAVLSDGRVRCWGYNHFGQLGDGTQVDRATPVEVQGLTDVVEVALGGGDGGTVKTAYSCARRDNGEVWCWGDGLLGQMGQGTMVMLPVLSPVQVPLPGAARLLASGAAHLCAVLADNSIRCWGVAIKGQLGSGQTPAIELSPVLVEGLTGAVELALGIGHTCARQNAGTLMCWGDNSYSQLGPGHQPIEVRPVMSTNITNATGLGVVADSTCAVVDGGLQCWGDNQFGQLGDDGASGTVSAAPVSVVQLPASLVRGVSMGGVTGHFCAWLEDGHALCWGFGSRGALGTGTANDSRVPVLLGVDGVTAVACGNMQSCALRAGNGVWCWGTNNHGELGRGTMDEGGVFFTPGAVVW